MSDLEEQIRSLVENFTVETDFDYGFGGDLVEVQSIDRPEAYGLIEAFVRPMLERAEKAEASLRESDAALQAAREACPYSEPGHVLCDCAQMWKTRAEVTQVNATYWFRQDADRRKEIDVLGARLRRVEARVEEWERIAAQPGYSSMRDWASVHAAQIRIAMKEDR